MSFDTWFQQTKPIMPVIVIENLEHAIPLAKALMAGGIHCLEVTLRTPEGLDAIKLIAQSCPDAIVGAGTVTSVKQMKQVKEAGAKFAISPGISPDLCKAARDLNLPYAPGVMNPSDIMVGLEYGLSLFKLFPADLAGGPKMIKALSGPFPNITFCPTGGVCEKNVASYFELDNVVAVGGSWVCPKSLVDAQDWKAIESLAAKVFT
jgi:2-dehydro-3-deoxyphosphogluconate aldolase/(4S)-4-hydroxy-2-oxoglutarate aldolase